MGSFKLDIVVHAVIIKPEKLRQEDFYVFRANLDYIQNSKWRTKGKNQESFIKFWVLEEEKGLLPLTTYLFMIYHDIYI